MKKLNPLRINVVLNNVNKVESKSNFKSSNTSKKPCHFPYNTDFPNVDWNAYEFESLNREGEDLMAMYQHSEYFGFPVRPLFINLICNETVADGTIMRPNTTFTKKWRLRNSGTKTWPHGSKFVWNGGDKLTDEISVDIKMPNNGIHVDEKLDVSVILKAPKLPGQYTTYWKMSLPSGETFGQRLWVIIEVGDPSKNKKKVDYWSHPIGLSGDEILKFLNCKPFHFGESSVSTSNSWPPTSAVTGRVPMPGVDSSRAQPESTSIDEHFGKFNLNEEGSRLAIDSCEELFYEDDEELFDEDYEELFDVDVVEYFDEDDDMDLSDEEFDMSSD
ncbi:hypothetical protein ACJIZ3_005186 [Penstemon smallii]|uniref:Nbr1 FW domain-containing protein n=1 Tax=Penstemon smallii TaxID=265156 RepID=A0ABD3S4B2_9LAMI